MQQLRPQSKRLQITTSPKPGLKQISQHAQAVQQNKQQQANNQNNNYSQQGNGYNQQENYQNNNQKNDYPPGQAWGNARDRSGGHNRDI